jgi:biopolymer transport protein ExbD
MSLRRHRKRKSDAADLDITTFLNLMVVLIPFLLITAVFSRITIQELNLPEASAGGADTDEPLITIEVIIRQENLEISNGEIIITSIPLVDGEHDIRTLTANLLELKDRYSEKTDATLLIEPDIEYETIIHVMDAVKMAEVYVEGEEDEEGDVQHVVLFPHLSVGDAP